MELSALNLSGQLEIPPSFISHFMNEISHVINDSLSATNKMLMDIQTSISNFSCCCVSSTPTQSSTFTYFVSPTGNDSAPVVSGAIFRSIQRAIDVVNPGDSVLIYAGIYYERLQMKNTGTMSNPILIQGEMSPDGKPLVTIDGSDPVSSGGWSAAPEVGPGVYKLTGLPYVPWMMTVDGDREVWRIANKWMDGEIKDIFGGNGGYPVTNGKGVLALPASQLVYPYGTSASVNFWDGLEALYGYTGGVTYIRFRNGDNPNTREIRVSPGPYSQFSLPKGACATIKNLSYYTLAGFVMRGARNSVILLGTDPDNKTINNIIENCELLHGNMRVRISGGANYNIIRKNHMEMKSLGVDDYLPDQDSPGSPWPSRVHQRHLYNIDKFLISGVGGEDDRHVGIHSDGTGLIPSGNAIQENMMYGGGQAIYSEEHNDTIFEGNTCVANFAQHVYFAGPNKNYRLFGNKFYTPGQYNIRSNNINKVGGVYIYRNKFWIPSSTGEHFFLGLLGSVFDDSHMDIWIYHNSIAGGTAAFIHNFNKGFGPATLNILNNVISTRSVIFNGYPEKIGIYDYNWGYRDSVDQPWAGSHNILSTTQMWLPEFILPSFILASSSDAARAGIDLSKTFQIQFKTFSALPGMIIGYAGDTGKPDMGVF